MRTFLAILFLQSGALAQTVKAPVSLSMPAPLIPVGASVTAPTITAAPNLAQVSLPNTTFAPAPVHFDVPAVPAVEPQLPAGAVRPSRPDYQPHEGEPSAILPDGKPLRPDSYIGGFHGSHVTPEEVVREGGFKARGPVEDWRLQEHSEQRSLQASAFRGSTQFVANMEGDGGAAYWADEGGWVYDIRGVPTWDVNSDLDGRVQRPNGTYRGNLMHGEAESAIPAEIPIECIVRWGQVRAAISGKLFVPSSGWAANPQYDAAACLRFWG